jgi:hypothetical protein
MIQGADYGILYYVNTAPYGAHGAFVFTGSGTAAAGGGGSTLALRAYPQSNEIRLFPTTNARMFPIT